MVLWLVQHRRSTCKDMRNNTRKVEGNRFYCGHAAASWIEPRYFTRSPALGETSIVLAGSSSENSGALDFDLFLPLPRHPRMMALSKCAIRMFSFFCSNSLSLRALSLAVCKACCLSRSMLHILFCSCWNRRLALRGRDFLAHFSLRFSTLSLVSAR